ncbi:MAG: hypothetical protein Q4F05_09125 [bacterium]|nr:hypothetical protein [bacterium]
MLTKTHPPMWQFSEIPAIEESTFNKVLERFYDLGISGLTRENIQNSLDGKNPENSEPVIVTIKTGKVHQANIPGIEEIKGRIACLQGRNSYTKETIAHMQETIKKLENDQYVDYISFEDANTKGLKGAKNGQSDSKEDTWGIYAYNKGVHFEENDSEVEKARGGSHGIGKIASNAASELHMMYFANCDAEGNQHLGGTVQLVEHKYHSNYYRNTGYFTKVEETGLHKTKFYPFENTFDEVFSKKTRGLKIIIPFLREQFNNEKEIIKTICDSFFIAILQQKLIVLVNDHRIDHETIEKYVLNSEYYKQEYADMKENYTPWYYKTYQENEPMNIDISSIKETYHFKLYFNYDENMTRGRVAVVRTIGMKIEDKKVTGYATRPFNAVLIPDSATEDVFLKSLENESHTELSCDHIKDQKEQRNAKRFINNMSKVIGKIIDEAIRSQNPTDGAMDTKDILYVVENQFKKDLEKEVSTVKLAQGKKPKTIVKVASLDKKAKQIRTEKQNKGSKPPKEKEHKQQLKKSKDVQGEENKARFSTTPNIVQRAIARNSEYVQFDFSRSPEMKNETVCDVTMTIIDGMGEEYPNEFKINKNYDNIVDMNTGATCKVENNLIKDVQIDAGCAKLKMKLKDGFNRALKFVYYVEV